MQRYAETIPNHVTQSLTGHIAHNLRFYFLALIWIVSGIIAGTLAHIVVIGTLVLLAAKRMYLELFLGFLLVLILSDSRLPALNFIELSREYYIILLMALVFVDKELRPLVSVYVYFIPFFIVAVISLTFNSPQTIVSALKTLSYFLILFVIPNIFTFLYKKYDGEFLKNLIYFLSTLLVVGLLMHLLNSSLTTLAGRFRGVFGNPNGLGTFLTLFFILFEIIKSLRPGLFSKKENLFLIAIGLISLLMCGSRTALASIMIFYSFKFLARISKPLAVLALIIIVFFFQVFLGLLPEVIQALNLTEYARLESLRDGSGRLVAYQFAWVQIQEAFWLGKGFGYSELLFTRFAEPLSKLGHQGGTHNTYLSIWLETGLVGVVFFIGAWFSLFLKSIKRLPIALPVALAILFSSFFESWLASSLNAYTIFVVIILSTLLFVQTEEELNSYE